MAAKMAVGPSIKCLDAVINGVRVARYHSNTPSNGSHMARYHSNTTSNGSLTSKIKGFTTGIVLNING
ncbi:hypothetical protein PCANC_08430 [Puccinia coronata f. sp. avenae]|uniref:Uncharacterized protein n=1 Tax=Puccinia coronata f. sp. avenae TaxID=200324 RepID=A0A2N5T5U2_9BASI|nr:hypothetical protein PCANC_08248 [Puccinia coronata f. sp. avenae]PLW51998.1 hypothetical protein PCANC_08430 [Puccinia coronata f. sp. avenae]